MAILWQSVIGAAIVVGLCLVALRAVSIRKEQRLRPPHDNKSLPIQVWMPPNSAFLHIFICRAVDFWNDGLSKTVFTIKKSGEYDVAVLCDDPFKPNKVVFQTSYNRPIAIINDVMHSENRDREIARALGRCIGFSFSDDPVSVMYAKSPTSKFKISKKDRQIFTDWITHLS